MELFLVHIAKSTGLLSLFYLAYHFLLRNNTNFNKNRFFLLAGILSAAFLPFVHFTRIVVVETGKGVGEIFDAGEQTTAFLPKENFDLWQLMGIIYILVTAFLLGRFVFQIARIAKLALPHLDRKEGDFLYIQTGIKTSPFSYFNVIVYNPASHSEEELRMVLEHEKVHARQFHTLDILLANLAAALLWFNPLSWFYRQCVEENLEYIADRETIRATGKQKEYQYALLRVSQVSAFPGLLNHFHRSFIKSRILMLAKGPSTRNYEWKRFVVVPALFFFLIACNTEEEIVFSQDGESIHSQAAMEQEPVFYVNSTTPDSYLRGIEAYFRDNHPDLQIAFTGTTRGLDQSLTGFQIETKFKGEEHFTKRMENLNAKKLKPSFAIQYSSDQKALIIKEQFKDEVQITITKEAIHADLFERSID